MWTVCVRLDISKVQPQYLRLIHLSYGFVASEASLVRVYTYVLVGA